MLRKLFLCCAFGSCVALLLGCPKKTTTDDGADAAEEAGPVAVAVIDAAPAAPVAKNAAEVARFPAEKPLADDDAKILDLFAQVKTGCKSGANVALVKAGTDPFKIAEFQDCILITFTDPKDPSGTQMGWVPKAAFVLGAPRDAGLKDAATDGAIVVDAAVPAVLAVKCPAGQETVVNVAGGGGVCRRKCTADKDCKIPTAGACAPATTLVGRITKVCANEAP